MALPTKLKPKLYHNYNQEQQLWHDLINQCANPYELYPVRPGEDNQVYQYRVGCASSWFPLLYCQKLLKAAVLNQEVFSHNPDVDTEIMQYVNVIADCLVETLVEYGEVIVVPCWQSNGDDLEPKPILVKPYQVRVASEDLSTLIWADYQDNILDNNLEPSSQAYLWVYQDGLLQRYSAPLRIVPNRFPSADSPYCGKFNHQVSDEFVADSEYTIKNVPKPIKYSYRKYTPTEATSYLRVRLSWLDVLNATGYVQRYIKPQQSPSLDIPIQLDELDTGNNYLIQADSFGFAEMGGNTVAALLNSLQVLAQEQLQEFGLDLHSSVSQSGDAIVADSARFKQMADSLGALVLAATVELAEIFFPNTNLQLHGLQSYQLNNKLGRLKEAHAFLDLLAKTELNTTELQRISLADTANLIFSNLASTQLEPALNSLTAKPANTTNFINDETTTT